MKKIETVPFKVEMNAYQKNRAAERFKWCTRKDRFTNPESPYYIQKEGEKAVE